MFHHVSPISMKPILDHFGRNHSETTLFVESFLDGTVRSREATPSSPSDEIFGEMEVMLQTHFLPVILEIMKTWFEKAG